MKPHTQYRVCSFYSQQALYIALKQMETVNNNWFVQIIILMKIRLNTVYK